MLVGLILAPLLFALFLHLVYSLLQALIELSLSSVRGAIEVRRNREDLFGRSDGAADLRGFWAVAGLLDRPVGALEIPCHFCKLKKRNDTCEKNLILM